VSPSFYSLEREVRDFPFQQRHSSSFPSFFKPHLANALS